MIEFLVIIFGFFEYFTNFSSWIETNLGVYQRGFIDGGVLTVILMALIFYFTSFTKPNNQNHSTNRSDTKNSGEIPKKPTDLEPDPDKARNRDQLVKFLTDIRNEINENISRLTGRGLRMITPVWDSGVSIGMMQNLSSEQVQRLSKIYHRIKSNHAEAVICRDAGELVRSLPGGPGKEQAQVRWRGLSIELEKREKNLKNALEELINETNFWVPLTVSN